MQDAQSGRFCQTHCNSTNFRKQLIFVNCNFTCFINTNFRKPGPAIDQSVYEKPSEKTNFQTFAQLRKFTKISPVYKKS